MATVMTVKQAAAIFSKDAAMTLHDNLFFLRSISKEDDTQWKKKYNDVSPGDRIAIRKPARFRSRTGLTFSGFDFEEDNVAMSVTNVLGVDINGISATEMATDLSMEKVKNISERIIVPAAKQLATDLEAAVLNSLYAQVYNVVGTAGTAITTKRTFADAGNRIGKFLAPMTDRYALVDGDVVVAVGDNLQGIFNPQSKISGIFTNGGLPPMAGFKEIGSNELLPYLTNGADVTGVATVGAGQTGSTLNVNGLNASTTGIVRRGQVFTIAGVFAIHPETRTAYPFLQQFTVLADANSDAGGAATLSISPAIVTSAGGTKQTVSAAPGAAAALTFVGNASTIYRQHLAYHADAFRWLTLPLPKMEDAAFAETASFDGVDITLHRYWDKDAYTNKTRLDVLWASAAVRPEHACRMIGS